MEPIEQSEVIVDSTVVGSVGTNCYIVHRRDSDRCVVIDPGEDGARISRFIKGNQLILEDILLTHGHFDHILGVSELVSGSGGRVCIYEGEKTLLGDAGMNVSNMAGRPVGLRADVLLKDGQVYEAAGMKFQVIHTPGHTKGSCCYYLEQEKMLFCGDTLFFESIGRADLPTGNSRELLATLRDKVLVLPDDVKVYTGHGPVTEIGYEKENNPYVTYM